MERYTLSYREFDGNFKDIPCKTKKEGEELYYMLTDKDCDFKVLYDNVNGEQILFT